MSERPRNRKPATFKLDDPSVVVTDPNEEGRPARGTIHITPENDAPQLPVALEQYCAPVRISLLPSESVSSTHEVLPP